MSSETNVSGGLTQDLVKEIEQAAEKAITEVKKTDSVDVADFSDKDTPEQKTEDKSDSEADGNVDIVDDSSDSGDGSSDDTDTDSGGVEKVAEPEPEFISEDTLARAIDAGIALGDALSFPNEQALERVISAMERRLTGARKGESRERVPEGDLLAELPKLDPENYDPEVIKYLEALAGVVKKQQEELRTARERDYQTQQSAREYTTREVENWFDKQVESLGEAYADTLGSGRYRSLNQGSQQFKNREKVAETMSILLSGYNATGRQPPDREEVFDMAVGMVFADKIEQIHGAEITKDLRERSSQHIQRAGGRKVTAQTTPEQETAEVLKQRFGI